MVAAVYDACERSFRRTFAGLDQLDIGVRSHRMGPFDVKRDLEEPPFVLRWQRAGLAQHVVLGEIGRIGQAEFLVENVKRAGIKVGIGRVHEARVVADVGDRDRLAGAVAVDAVGKSDVVNAVRPGDLRRRVTCRAFEVGG